jgi:hypothetical protein
MFGFRSALSASQACSICASGWQLVTAPGSVTSNPFSLEVRTFCRRPEAKMSRQRVELARSPFVSTFPEQDIGHGMALKT